MSPGMAAMEMLEPYRGGDLLLDTNLLLLQIIGKMDADYVKKFSRTANRFHKSDVQLLQECIGMFRRVVSTPNIVTETSHFLQEIREHERKNAAYDIFRNLIDQVDERYFKSQKVLSHAVAVNFGVTDAANALFAEEKCLLLSVDAPLVDWAQRKNLPAINFTYLRTF